VPEELLLRLVAEPGLLRLKLLLLPSPDLTGQGRASAATSTEDTGDPVAPVIDATWKADGLRHLAGCAAKESAVFRDMFGSLTGCNPTGLWVPAAAAGESYPSWLIIEESVALAALLASSLPLKLCCSSILQSNKVSPGSCCCDGG
jgi:hypothetical protein